MNAHEAARPVGVDPVAPASTARVGTLLREAREREGWSVDEVAQQLKLAPRQVRALEEEEFALLPGRTFVRGFVRNYSRLLRVDAEQLLAALPAGSADAGLESPTLHPTAPTMGELPASESVRPTYLRWAVPLIVVIVAAVAAYEFFKPSLPVRTNPSREQGSSTAPAVPPARSAPTKPADQAVPLPNPVSGSPLPNPVADVAPPAVPAVGPASETGAAAAVAGTRNAQAPAAPIAAAGERALVFSFRDHSWTEVREQGGRVLLSAMMSPGARRELKGTPPFDLIIGNAVDVTLTFDGRKVDLVPHTRQSVARLTLQ